MTEYRTREITPRLQRALRSLPVVVLSGLRQAGKSTLLQREPGIAAGHAYRTLDDFGTLASARSNPEALLAQPVILDEVQRCPDLLVAIKRAIDSNREKGRFILSGSANLALMASVSESLAGRAGYFTLHPMTRREIRRETEATPFIVQLLANPNMALQDAEPIRDIDVLKGGLPPVCVDPELHAADWLRAYIQTYVERDVRQLSQIADLVAFQTLAQRAALRTGQVLSIASVARDARLTAVTAGRYLDLLETSFLIRRLPPFLRNRGSRLIKSPKLHFTDSGLAARMAGIDSIEPGRDDRMRGPLYESHVVQNISAILEAHLPDARLGFWHEQGRHEVDLVVEDGRRTVAIEIKAATRWTGADLAGLRAFLDRTPGCVAAILAHNGSQAIRLGDRLLAVPIGRLLA